MTAIAQDIKVLIVDDHDLVRSGISMMLSGASGIRVVGQCASGEEAIDSVRELHPDVVLMDLKMPGIGGMVATKKLLRVKTDLKVLVVTVCDNDLYPSKLMQAGAFGYLTKGASMAEMIRAINMVHAGQRYISPEIARLLAIKHLTDRGETPFESLSERELQVTLMIVQGRRVQDIADHLCLSSKTVNSYRYRIFEKLDVQNDVELTHMALRHGLLEGQVEG